MKYIYSTMSADRRAVHIYQKGEGKDKMDIHIGRIVVGIGWPGELPGFACVIGEELYPEKMGFEQVYHLHLLFETEDPDLSRLLKKSVDLKNEFKAIKAYARDHEPSIRFLREWNKKRDHRDGSRLRIFDPPFAEDGHLEYHINILKGHLDPDRKSFHLLPESRLASQLLMISARDIPTATDVQYPALAAVGYAVAALSISIPRTESRPTHAKMMTVDDEDF